MFHQRTSLKSIDHLRLLFSLEMKCLVLSKTHHNIHKHQCRKMSQVAVLPCVFKICVYVCACVCVCVGSLCMNNWFLSWLALPDAFLTYLVWTCSFFSPSFSMSCPITFQCCRSFYSNHHHTYHSICHSNELCVCMRACVLGGLLCSKVKPAGNVISLN